MIFSNSYSKKYYCCNPVNCFINGYNALYIACKWNNIEAVKLLLEKKNLLIDQQTDNGEVMRGSNWVWQQRRRT